MSHAVVDTVQRFVADQRMHLRLVQLFSVTQFPEISELAERCLVQISRLPDPGTVVVSCLSILTCFVVVFSLCFAGPPDARVLVQGGLQPLLHLLQCGHPCLQRYGLQCVAELSRFQLLQVVRFVFKKILPLCTACLFVVFVIHSSCLSVCSLVG